MKVTDIFLIAFAIILIIYDIWATSSVVSGGTISERIWAISAAHPVLPFALGFLAGHLFFQR